jgi:hypothetical protein
VLLVGSFAVMYLVGYSLANLSLMAFTISTGFVADDPIAMYVDSTSCGRLVARSRGFWNAKGQVRPIRT